MHSQDDVKFVDAPCPKCHEKGNETGYVVDSDCPECLGTGRLRAPNYD